MHLHVELPPSVRWHQLGERRFEPFGCIGQREVPLSGLWVQLNLHQATGVPSVFKNTTDSSKVARARL